MAGEEDIVLRISPDDKGALALLQSILQALKGVKNENKELAAAAEKAADVIRKQVDATKEKAKADSAAAKAAQKALRDQSEAARKAAAAQAREQRAQQRQNEAAIRAERKARQALIREEREREREAARTRRAEEREKRAEIRAIEKVRAAELKAQRDAARLVREAERQRKREEAATLRAAAQELRDREKLRRAEDRAAREQSRTLQRNSEARTRRVKDEEREAQRRAREEAKAARDAEKLRREEERRERERERNRRRAERERARELQRELRAREKAERERARQAREAVLAERRAARERLQQERAALRAARARQAAAERANRETKRSSLLLRESTLAARSVVRQFIVLGTVYAGFRAVRDFVAAGLQFNETLETAQLGIASLITAQSKLTDESGRTLGGIEALNAAYGLAGAQVDKLRIAGIQTAATTEQLVDAFQQAVGAGIRVGLSLDQIRVFTVRATQAAFALGVPMNQLNQEVRSILDGTIDRNSRVAKALQLTNQEVRLAREQNRLQDLLNEKFSAFDIAGQKSVETFRILKSNIAEAFQVFAGDATRPLFESLRLTGGRELAKLFNFATAEIDDDFRGLLTGFQFLFREVGSGLSDGIESAVEGAQELSRWVEENRDLVAETASNFGTLIRETGALAGAILTLPVSLAKASTESLALGVGIQLATSAMVVLRENLDVFLGLLTALAVRGGIASLIAGGPILQITAGVFSLLVVMDQLINASQRLRLEEARRLEQIGDQNAQIGKLVANYEAAQSTLTSTASTTDELRIAREQLRSITAELIKIDPRFAKVLEDQALSADEAAKAIERLRVQRVLDTAIMAIEAEAALKAGQARLDQAKASLGALPGTGDRSVVARRNFAIKSLEREEKNVAVLEARYKALKRAVDESNEAEERLRQRRSKVTPSAIGSPTENESFSEREARQVANRLADARLRLAKAQIERERALLEQQYEENLISAAVYYQGLLLLANREVEAEIENRQAKLAEARAEERQRYIDEIEAQKDERIEKEIEINTKLGQDQRKYAEVRAEIQQELLRAEGNIVESAAQDLFNEYIQRLERAVAEGDYESLSNILTVIGFRLAKTQADAFEQEFGRITDTLQNDLERVQILQDAGVLTTRAAERSIADANRQAIGSTEALLQQMLALQDVLGRDPEYAARIEQIRIELEKMKLAVRQATDVMLKLEVAGRDALEEGLASGIETLLGNVRDLQGAFKQMASSIVADINRIISRLIAQLILEQAIAALRGLVGLSSGGPVKPTTSVKFATGGIVQGPGTNTSDSVLARLSRGEYVVRARAVERYGTDFLDDLNSMRIKRPRRFAQGGAVTPSPMASGAAGNSMFRGEIGLEDGLVLRAMETKGFEDMVVRAVSRRARSVNEIIRRRG